MLSVIMLSVIMLNVVMLSVVALLEAFGRVSYALKLALSAMTFRVTKMRRLE
jgi:hypothetical protein